jgi:hypothetical protein
VDRTRRLRLRFPPVNLTASPIHGVGGLGLLVLALLVTLVAPVAWWMVLAPIGGGIALGILRIAIRARGSA